MHIYTATIALSIMFWRVAVPLDKSVSARVAKKMGEQIAQSIHLDKYPRTVTDAILTYLKTSSTKDESNDRLLTTNIAVVAIVTIGLITYLSIAIKHTSDAKAHAFHGLVGLISAFVLEYVFFTTIASKYVPIMPDAIARHIASRIPPISLPNSLPSSATLRCR